MSFHKSLNQAIKDADKLKFAIESAWMHVQRPCGEIVKGGSIEAPLHNRLLTQLVASKQLGDIRYQALMPLYSLRPDAAVFYLKFYLLYALEVPELYKNNKFIGSESNRMHAIEFLSDEGCWEVILPLLDGGKVRVIEEFAIFYSKYGYLFMDKEAERRFFHIIYN